MTTELTKAAPNNHGPIHETDLYDFAGWLTTRPGVMAVGSSCEAGPMAEAVGEYIKTFPERFALTQRPAAQTEREAWQLINPQGQVVAVERTAIKALARIDGYKPTVEGLLGYEEAGWRVVPASLPAPHLDEDDDGDVTGQPGPLPETGWDEVPAGAFRKPSPTAGMNLGERIKHVGGRENAAGYIEFGSVMAVRALVRQYLRDLPAPQQATPASAPQSLLMRLAGIAAECSDPDTTDALDALIAATQQATPEPLTWAPLKRSADGRAAVLKFFMFKLKRHDFLDYITNTLAADFACVLGGYLQAMNTAATPEPVHHASGMTADELWLQVGRLRAQMADAGTKATPEPVGEAWGWAIEDKHGVAQAIRPARKEFFGCVQSSEPLTAEDVSKMDREWAGLAPHRIVTLYTRPAPGVPEPSINWFGTHFTYKNQPCDNVTCWRLGEAARNAKPGGDLIDHGLSLLHELEKHGYGVFSLAAAQAKGG